MGSRCNAFADPADLLAATFPCERSGAQRRSAPSHMWSLVGGTVSENAESGIAGALNKLVSNTRNPRVFATKGWKILIISICIISNISCYFRKYIKSLEQAFADRVSEYG